MEDAGLFCLGEVEGEACCLVLTECGARCHVGYQGRDLEDISYQSASLERERKRGGGRGERERE